MLRLGRRLGLRLRSAEQRLQLRLRLCLPASFVAKTTWTWARDEYESLQFVASSVCSWNYAYACVCVGVCVAVCVWMWVAVCGHVSCCLGLYIKGLPWLGLALRFLWLPHFAFTTYAFYVFTVLCPLCVCVCRCVCVPKDSTKRGEGDERRRGNNFVE